MELADKLDISYQAASNWERGNSMPDNAKLPELPEKRHESYPVCWKTSPENTCSSMRVP